MKTHLIYIAALIILGAGLFAEHSNRKKQQGLKEVAESNFQNSQKKVSEYSTLYNITQQEYEELFSEHYSQAKKDNIQPKRIQSHEVLKYVYLVDTLLVPQLVLQDQPEGYLNTYQYFDNCVSAEIETNCDAPVNVKLSGQIEINKYNYLEKAPKWFWRGLWFKGKWLPKSKVTNDCGWEIKENTIFELND